MESVLVKVVSFIAVIVVGYLLKRVGFFRSEGSSPDWSSR